MKYTILKWNKPSCWHNLNYADCIHCKGVRTPLNPKGMTQNSIWWWGSSSGDPRSEENPFIVIDSHFHLDPEKLFQLEFHRQDQLKIIW